MLTRRGFLVSLALGGVATLPLASRAFPESLRPEVETLRIARSGSLCGAPQFIAEELLRDEGFREIVYVDSDAGIKLTGAIGSGTIDISLNYVAPNLMGIDAGTPITILGGVMVGCFELFANAQIRRLLDLKGKRVGITGLGSSAHVFLSSMMAHVGLDPRRDVQWITSAEPSPKEMFINGKTDAFLGFPPEPQELRARNVGHVIVNSALDRPWSQYFCCVFTANREFVRTRPVAAKRALRAILKAADLCASEPQRAARRMVDRGFAPRYDYAFQTLKELPYDKWREYDPEDTLRFYALRLGEVGMIKSTPQQLIASGTDWRFLNELKRELKA